MNNQLPIIDLRDHTLSEKLCSPPTSTFNTLIHINNETLNGRIHQLYEQFQKKYGDSGLSSNILVPYLDSYALKNEKKNVIRDLIIINHEDDAERIASKHLKKMPNLKLLLYDSIISTTNTATWSNQRKNFGVAFRVSDNLASIVSVSQTLAEECADTLWELSSHGKRSVEISEFFLHETMKQLLISMFGVSKKFESTTNKKIRDALRDIDDYVADFSREFIEEIKTAQGPLSKAFKNHKVSSDSFREQYGNSIIFTFAGHDTTGHTLTWLIYELAKHPEYQHSLQREVDTFWREQIEPDVSLSDFKRLPFMTRCIMETLRLWPALANGTYRELISDDYIVGKSGHKIMVPKGTYVQIPNWSRHRNKKLWGDDADVFNPNRAFEEDELWNDSVFNTYNPNSERFSPFTFTPRDCLGKNFSQIEMRLILLHLCHCFSFELRDKFEQPNISMNYFTMGPRNINNKTLKVNRSGLFVRIHKRSKAKL